MKYLMTFENLTDYKVEVLTARKIGETYNKLYRKYRDFNLKDKIHYFDYQDMRGSWSGNNDVYDKTLRLITAYDDKDILGICKFAYWTTTKRFAVSYLSTNNDYFNMGVSKKILEVLFQYFSKTYPGETLGWSGYSIDGWKYLHPKILELSKKYNVKLEEKGIEYVIDWTDEKRELFNKSREEIKSIYGYYPY